MYDALQRLVSAASNKNWTEAYSYDGFGNLTGMTPTGTAGAPSLSLTLDASTNRVSGPGNVSYDANGNLTGTPLWALAYDVANRVVLANYSNVYLYDSDNRRIYYRATSGVETVYVYGASGEKLAAYTVGGVSNNVVQLTLQSQNVYFAGRLISAEGNAVGVDRLGSVRWGTYGSGNPNGRTYYPYGVEYTTTGNDTEKYATYTRDSLTGLDYAVNRYYASIWGRFLAPDPSWGSVVPGDPQAWNRYAYALNDPANRNDPDGLIPCGDLEITGTGTISEVVNGNSNLGLLSELVWAESDHTWSRQASIAYDAEQDAIAWTVVNRWKVLNGYLSVAGVSDPGTLGWGPDYATVRQIIGQPGQFSTITGGIWHPQLRSDLQQTLADVMDGEPSAGDELDLDLTSFGLGEVSMTHECFDVWQSEVAASFALYGGSTDPFASAGYTTSFHHGMTTTPLQPFFGNFGTANNFFGIPAGSVTTNPNGGIQHKRPIRLPKPPRPGRPHVQ